MVNIFYEERVGVQFVYKALKAQWNFLWWLHLLHGPFRRKIMRTEFRTSRLLSSIGKYLRASAKQKLVKYCHEGRHLFSPFGWDIGKKLCVNFPVGRPAPGAARPISFLIRSAQEIIFSRSAFSRGIIRATYCSGVRQGLSRRGRSRTIVTEIGSRSSTSPVWLPELLLSDPEPPLFPGLGSRRSNQDSDSLWELQLALCYQ